MTVNQFLQDKYIGKSIKFFVEERKNENNEIVEKSYSLRQDGYFKKWTIIEWMKRDKGIINYFRDVLIEDKIVEIKPTRNYWTIKTLNGYYFRFGIDDELSVS